MRTIEQIRQDIRTQDNSMGPLQPMFCLQIKVREIGYDTNYVCHHCWQDVKNLETVYDDDADFEREPTEWRWQEFGYLDRWETLMVAFTAQGLEDYLRADGHNVKRLAFRGETRISVESFYRCNEMITVRKMLEAK